MTEPSKEQKKKNLMTLGMVFCLGTIAFYGFRVYSEIKNERRIVQFHEDVQREINAKRGEFETPKAPAAPKAPESISDLTLGEFSQDMASFVGIKAGDEMEMVKDQIRLYMAGEGDGSNAQAASFQTHYRTDGRTLFVATQMGLLDDSVSAQQVMVVFIPKTMSKSMVEGYGLRVKCQRGDNTELWQVKPCP